MVTTRILEREGNEGGREGGKEREREREREREGGGRRGEVSE